MLNTNLNFPVLFMKFHKLQNSILMAKLFLITIEYITKEYNIEYYNP